MANILIVDDSFFIRAAIRKILESSNLVENIYEASNGIEALEILKNQNIDLVTLDVEMPKMNGLETLERIKKENISTQIIMVSAYTTQGAKETIKALELGALDFIAKPKNYADFYKVKDELLRKIENAILKKKSIADKLKALKEEKKIETPPPQIPSPPIRKLGSKGVVAIGISTGGPQTLGEILPKLPSDYPYPITIAIHMPDTFTKSFAEHLNSKCKLNVKEAEENEVLKPGTVYISRGRINMKITGNDSMPIVNYVKDDSIIYIPSANSLLSSCAKVFKENTCGIVMTGMGDDGSRGIVDVKKNGGITVAEDPKTAILWAMPENAIKTGCVDFVLKKDEIPNFLLKIAKQ
ncbi:response regulator receiver modulated CheB methylesterase [Hydrogenobaculum sp. Y04AAS1]|uniref:chemotaxis-specific protein-glutamate methyltransferase CheB n=1 Tax=Hydrogenobaculum sp. (strain Y04AAS1) TaxID=380749 RepID=UPI00015BC9C6|nr:response regulator receiver modulated CheB methylesterase [Hydrogenobaculum sp. Y04AAS1]HCT66517.1 chemotaxis-specific protein-glutamate methyltransferase CheB [Hydrogenobaculum sp.]